VSNTSLCVQGIHKLIPRSSSRFTIAKKACMSISHAYRRSQLSTCMYERDDTYGEVHIRFTFGAPGDSLRGCPDRYGGVGGMHLWSGARETMYGYAVRGDCGLCGFLCRLWWSKSIFSCLECDLKWIIPQDWSSRSVKPTFIAKWIYLSVH
jgi:hypothetical protein